MLAADLAVLVAVAGINCRPFGVMGFNRRKIEDERRRAAEKKAAERRATDAQVA